MDKSLTVTEAARKFSDVINRAYYRNESTTFMKSGVPVARIVPVRREVVTGNELAEKWKEFRHLNPEEAEEFEKDVRETRKTLNVPPKSERD